MTNAKTDAYAKVVSPPKKNNQKNKRKGGPQSQKQLYRNITLPPVTTVEQVQEKEATNAMVVFRAGENKSVCEDKETVSEPDPKNKKPTPTNSENSDGSAAAAA